MDKKTSTVKDVTTTIKNKYKKIVSLLTERSKRIWCATEAQAYGYGGIKVIHEATGVSRPTIIKGIKELQANNITNDLNGCRVFKFSNDNFLKNHKLCNGIYILTLSNNKIILYQCINGNYIKLKLKNNTPNMEHQVQQLQENEIYQNNILSSLFNGYIRINRVRMHGGGRKKVIDKYVKLSNKLDTLIEPATRGDPENPLRWSSKSTIKLAEELSKSGYEINQKTVYNLLKKQKYSMKSNRKSQEGKASHPDRDAQFNFINEQTKSFQKQNLPVLSIDTKKKENLGNFKNNGKEWSLKGEHTEVLTHDFPDKELGKVAPHGIYDINNNKGFVSVGISSDTAEFAVNSIRSWYSEMGQDKYQVVKKIMITADCGGSNNYRSRLWKFELQELSNELDIEISVCHFPPGTSKWNKIEHRLFAQISQNWRGKPLVDLQTVVELIGNTTTTTGLQVKVVVDENIYEIGKKISDEDFEKINIEKDMFHGEWNYTIKPQKMIGKK